MKRGLASLVATAGAVLALPSTASAATNINAEGNPVTGGLAFNPSLLQVAAGETVQWTNTDFFAPHTVTSVQGLFDLGGSYGATPVTPAGFGPGQTVSRKFAAGSFSYFCRVHGLAQAGVVEAPVTIIVRRRARKLAGLAIRWGSGKPAEDQVYDVQRRQDGGRWRNLIQGTTKSKGLFDGPPAGSEWAYRARVRKAGDAAAVSGWSPPSSLVMN